MNDIISPENIVYKKPTLMNETDTSYFNKKYTYADIDEATPPVGNETGSEV